jgi:hypothetical protein
MKRVESALIGFGRRMCLGFLAATASALLTAAVLPAFAEEEGQPRWFGSVHDDMAMLIYGVPDSDYVMLYFSCAIGKRVMSVNVQDEESRAGEGVLLHVRLSAGREQIEFSGKAIPNQDSGGADVKGHLPLDDKLRRILTASGKLEIVVDGHTQHYALAGAAEPANKMIAACDSPKPANDLDVTVTNKAGLPLQSLAYSQAGVNSFDSGEFGNKPLEPGASRTFTIPDGRKICTFDISAVLAKDDAECCDMGKPAGTQNLCENAEFIVRD